MTHPPNGRQQGTVVAFDLGSGLGVVGLGDDRYPFHSAAIADGTRTIGVKAGVDFALGPGHLGRWEATDIRPLRS